MATTNGVLFCCLIATALTAPANNDQLDQATVNDVGANTVAEEKRIETVIQPIGGVSGATVQVTGVTGINTGLSESPVAPDNTPFKPQRTGSMFARFIDDIFQIPITVLQNVARLITNPFIQKKNPEVVATIS